MSTISANNLLGHLDLLPILLGFSATFLATFMLCKLANLQQWGHDREEGVQKFHVRPTSRLGGIAIAFGLAISGFLTVGRVENALTYEFYHYSFWFLAAATPVWLAGLVEDLTHKVGPTSRLIMATLSAAWLFESLGVSVSRTDVWFVDWLLAIPGGPLCVTLLVVAGFTHSVNIVDGFHGLASGLMIITVCALSYMAWKVGDALMLQMCLTSVAVLVGFFVFNWPKGVIFLGDAGAYLIGFWVVELGILIAMRNPSISPMAPVVAGMLPLIETLFSIYRRMFLKDYPVNHPDALHLHTLIYKRLLFNPIFNNLQEKKNVLNGRVALFFWVPAIFFSSAGSALLESTSGQLILMLTYLAMYVWLYRKLVRFSVPNFMKFR
jgi:UDP-N-acetylmuramyl pentapeptide phosphotransferase/UDP-N-acetylglucosamine-1-phosphate transferase